MRSTARQRSQGRELLSRSADIMAFYGTLVGEVPYPDLSVAVIESQIPGGHAPGHVAIINQPLATSPFVWRDDPASFHHFPDFFLAHELAHQWWGQAVGWENYHEQWLSEGFAQYFAALYAEHRRGPGAFADIVRQMARWSINESDQGPVYLGYRLGHLRGEGRVFRALVYNKAGAVLHMLRRMLGDEAFFRGVRAFYAASRFQKAGTEDVRRAFEEASSQPLEPFFEQWIFGQDVPVVTLKWQVIDQGRRVRVELRQPADSVFVFPATLERRYRDGTADSETVTIDAPVTTLERDLKGPLRRIELNDDRLTPVVVKR
jgi:aminopeptidase N